jgi:outer membrane receptor for ferrienterochelin and colicin
MTTLRHVLVFAVAAVLSAGAAAAEEEIDYLEMGIEDLLSLQVFEAASMQPVPLLQAPGTVYSFDRAAIRDLGVRRLAELLELVPGLQLSQYRKRHRSVWARGVTDRYNDKVLLLVDGVPRRHVYYGHFSAEDDLSLEPVDRVEVILGPASALYGSAAFGAVISITTVARANSGEHVAGVELASNQRVRGYYLQDEDRWSVYASYTDQQAPYDEDRRTLLGQPPVQPLGERFAELNLSYRATDELTFGLQARRAEYPFVFIVNFINIDIVETPVTLRADYSTQFDDDTRLNVVAWHDWDRWRETEVDNTTLVSFTEVQDATYTGVHANLFHDIGDHSLLAGLHWERQADDGMRSGTGPLLTLPGIRNDEIAFLLQDIWTVSQRMSLTLGLRYDAHDRFEDTLNYRAAMVVAPSEHSVFKLMRGTGTRVPSFREDLKVLEGTAFVPPQVQPEDMVTTELAYHRALSRWSMDVSIYRSDFDGFITDTDTPDLADEYFFNSPNPWRIYGMEARGGWMTPGGTRLHGALTYTDVEEQGTTREFPVASWTAGVGATIPIGGSHRLSILGSYLSSRTDYNDATFLQDDPDSHLRIDVSIQGNLRQDLRYRAGIYDLFGSRTFDPPEDFSTSRYNNERQERQVWVGLEWDLH